MLKIDVYTTRINIRAQEPLTVGLVGAWVRFSFSEGWKALGKIVVFRQGQTVKDQKISGDQAKIPWEVLQQPGVPLEIGIYGTDATGKQVIPTLWVRTEPVQPAPSPVDDPGLEPTAEVWQQAIGTMGDLQMLKTQAKTDLVSAINEANQRAEEAAKKVSKPEPLTFTGAAEAEYDGTQPVSVEIPKGALRVTVSKNSDGAYVATESFQAIRAAHISGRMILCHYDEQELLLTNPTAKYLGFTCMNKDGEIMQVTIDYAGGVTVGIKPLEVNGSSGTPGEDGGYYTPTVEQVSESSMKVSFLASKDGMAAVKDTTITLPAGQNGADGTPGADGYTPVKGTDYFTAADKAEMAEEAFATEKGQAIVSNIAEINEILAPVKEESLNLFNAKDVTHGKQRANAVGSAFDIIVDNPKGWMANQTWACKKGDVIRCNGSWWIYYLIYDSSGVCVATDYFDESKAYTVANETASFFTIIELTGTIAPSEVMMTRNKALPATYTPYVDTLSLNTIGQNRNAIRDLENGLPYFRKPFVVLSFDAFNLTDNRFAIVHDEYGYKATVAHKTKADLEVNKKVLSAGWDIGLYMLNGSPVEVSGQYEAAVSKTPTAEILEAWDRYVKSAVDEAAEAMVYNPVVWLARQGCSCYGLEQALKKYGIPMCRGTYNPDYSNDWNYSPSELPTMTVACKSELMPSKLDACKAAIADAVAGGYGVAFLTHGIYDTDEEANAHYGLTEACLRDFLDTVKGYVDAGQLEVVTYRDIYAKYYPERARELDYNRIMKMVTGVHVTTPDSSSGDSGSSNGGSTDSGEEAVDYTNVIKTSVGSDGAVFNSGKGWADNSRIGSGGIYLGNGSYWVTGHIEIDPNVDNVIRLKNMTFDSTTDLNYNNGVFFFDASYTRVNYNGSVNVMYANSMQNTDVVHDGNNIVQFTLYASRITNKDVKYFAISCGGIDETSIITVNEPID